MGQFTKIEWADSSCNEQSGCDGCELWNPKADIRRCYAGTLTERWAGVNSGWPVAFDKPQIFPGRIAKALKWPDLTGTLRDDKPWLDNQPRHIFLDDMGDTFTESLPIDWLAPYIDAMAESPHVWMFLTKRPQRMHKFFTEVVKGVPVNFMLGTSITSQATVKRVEALKKIQQAYASARLYISAEPLWGPVKLWEWYEEEARLIGPGIIDDYQWQPGTPDGPGEWLGSSYPAVELVIAGGESGHGAVPTHPAWLNDLQSQCSQAGVHFFFKQWGEFVGGTGSREGYVSLQNGRYMCGDKNTYEWGGGIVSQRVGKTEAGRLLGGREYNEFPQFDKLEILPLEPYISYE